MFRTILCSCLLAGAIAPAAFPNGAPQPACKAAERHQFDFWIGDWEVTQAGKPAGTNRIDVVLDGCALLENWTGKGGVRGHSLNFYDPDRGHWQQTWVDSSGSSLNLTGHFAGGRMMLSSLAPGLKQADRITWTPNADGSVRQLWEHTEDAGRTWTTAFDGLYRRKTPASAG